MSFPTGVDYIRAIQSPASVLPEGELRACAIDGNQMGLPLSWSGSNAIVFRLRRPSQQPLAFRCFTMNVQDVEARYTAYSSFYENASKELKAALVPAVYLPQGIHLPDGASQPWKPAVVMHWVEGKHLGDWVGENHAQAPRLRWLQWKLQSLASQMAASRFVHGDLQHRNIMVGAAGPVLVDYDSVILPNAQGLRLTTQGLAAFRHPLALDSTPPEALDRFAFLVLHVGLEALVQQPQIFLQFGKMEGLLFQGSDFKSPDTSALFRALRAHSGLRTMAENLTRVCRAPAAMTPDLGAFIASTGEGSAHPQKDGLPPWTPEGLKALEKLYRPEGQLCKRAPRVKDKAPTRRITQPSVQQAVVPAGLSFGATMVSATAGRLRAFNPALAISALAALALVTLLLNTPHIPILGWSTPQSSLASIRKDLGDYLAEQKDRLGPLIVHMDEELEQWRTELPDDLRLATLDAPGGTVSVVTIGQLRHNLAQTRAQAHQVLARYDAMLNKVDTTLQAPGLSPTQKAHQILSIPELPAHIQARLQRELPERQP